MEGPGIDILKTILWIYPPGPRIPVTNEGLFVGIPDPKNVIIVEKGDWNPGWGVDLNYTILGGGLKYFVFIPHTWGDDPI